MAFTRQNLGSTSTFTRDGALSETTSTPPFQIFQKSITNSVYSLGGTWKIDQNSATRELKFLSNNTPILTLTPSGATFTLKQLKLPSYSAGVTPSAPEDGLLINQDGNFLVYI